MLDFLKTKKQKNNDKLDSKGITEKSLENNKENKDKDALSEDTKQFSLGTMSISDIIAPSSIYVDFNYVQIGTKFYRTLFVSGYPRYVGANWLEPIINFEHPLSISMYYYPVDSKGVLDDLKKKITEFQATIRTDQEKGKVMDPTVLAALEDAVGLQESLVKGIERFFQFSFYVTIPANSLDELNKVTKRVEATLGSLLLISRYTTLQMEDAFKTTLPMGVDKISIIRNMDTSSLATTFPFTSSELTMNEGIMYGINRHNGSLVIFDRFSLPNANSVVFATSGAGKSYMVKLEILRSLLFGVEVIVIDPEREYKALSDVVGGEFIEFSNSSTSKINPFDLPEYDSNVSNEITENALGAKILSLHSLFKIIFGNEISNIEEALLDKAILETYRLKGITNDPSTHQNEAPLLSDLYKVLLGMYEPEAKNLVARLERYVKGSLSGIFNQRTTVNLSKPLTVFSVRNLEDVLRPIAYYMILDFIWTKVKMNFKKRLLIIDEAWYLMTNEDSAYFVYSIAKRARKYYLGLTTISQDINDFLTSDYGKAVVTNSAMKTLLRQSEATIDNVGATFKLSEGEQKLLLGAGVGEGLFFAGDKHVAIQVKASPEEDRIITTKPKDIVNIKKGNSLQTQGVGTTSVGRGLKSTLDKIEKVTENTFENKKEETSKKTSIGLE